MRISDWSSDVCSSDLRMARSRTGDPDIGEIGVAIDEVMAVVAIFGLADARGDDRMALQPGHPAGDIVLDLALQERGRQPRSDERREWKECVRTGRDRWEQAHQKQNKQKQHRMN